MTCHASALAHYRQAAFIAMGVNGELHPYAVAFLETGADPHGIYPIAARVAQLAADCEARGEPGARHEAWNEGALAGCDGDIVLLIGKVNPYPKEEPEHE